MFLIKMSVWNNHCACCFYPSFLLWCDALKKKRMCVLINNSENAPCKKGSIMSQ